MTTNKQKAAVHFCEQWLDVTFDGDINNFKQVSYFLSIYLDDASNFMMKLDVSMNLIYGT